jgi:CBS domain-containing protein
VRLSEAIVKAPGYRLHASSLDGSVEAPFTVASPPVHRSRATLERSITVEGAMTVAELMQPNVRTIGSEACVAEVVVSLADGHISGMPVVDKGGRIIGVVSATDVLTAEAEVEAKSSTIGRGLMQETPVRDIMTPRPYTVAPDEDVREAARQMLYADVHRLFVADGDRLVGVISTTDIVRAVATGKL